MQTETKGPIPGPKPSRYHPNLNLFVTNALIKKNGNRNSSTKRKCRCGSKRAQEENNKRWGASGGAAGTMLQFYTDDAPGLKISPNVVLVMSIGFIAFVAILHVMGKLYFVRKD
ncbi:Protein transport protein Sec61 subunit beta [Hibiscus syriacus]|uniref:Protein transport protein Sec61 subunit beta n=1 Tax=Hibiscus syriacus TaxID=106335 RepID=A0A6A3BZH8_HIBSY|nr:Protein transport protein Sec61 subunit beta [Hibiscus syriacus]